MSIVLSALGDCHASLRMVAIATVRELLELEGLLCRSDVCECAGLLQRQASSDMDSGVRSAVSILTTSFASLLPSPPPPPPLPSPSSSLLSSPMYLQEGLSCCFVVAGATAASRSG